MNSKKVILYSPFLKKRVRYLNLICETGNAFGFEVTHLDDEEGVLQSIKDVETVAFLCDDKIFSDHFQEILAKKIKNHDRLSKVLLVTKLKGNKNKFEQKFDNLLILSIPYRIFEVSVNALFNYLWLKGKLNNITGVTDPEFIKRLLSDAAHAINNILTGIQGYAELAQLNPNDRKLLKDAFHVVIESSYRIRNEIKNLRAFARVESPRFEQNNFYNILNESINLIKTQIKARGIDIVGNIDKGYWINCDNEQLVQVFFNVINDVVYNTRGKILIDSSLSDDGSRVTVTIGSTEYTLGEKDFKTLERIFAFNEPVLRIDSKEGKIENRNILSICNRIVHNHGGKIELSRDGDSKIFYRVTIPVIKGPVKGYPMDQAVLKEAFESLENLDMDILIVDDEEYVRNTIYYFFNKKGCRVIMAEDGEFGLQIAREKPLDLIFMDYLMPKMGGFEAAKKILETNGSVKIVFITGRDTLNEEELLKSGVYSCVKKPFEMRDLYNIAKKIAMEKGLT